MTHLVDDDNEENATYGVTYAGRSFMFKDGKWTIWDENGKEIPVIDGPLVTVENVVG